MAHLAPKRRFSLTCSSSVASLVTERHRAVKTLMRYLEPVVKQRLAMRAVSSTENVPVRHFNLPRGVY